MQSNNPVYENGKPFAVACYSLKDSAVVHPILNDLISDGYRIWYDNGFPPTPECLSTINAHIEGCSLFIVFVSRNSMHSQVVTDECVYALSLRKVFYVVYLEDVPANEIAGSLRARFANSQSVKREGADDGSFITELRYPLEPYRDTEQTGSAVYIGAASASAPFTSLPDVQTEMTSTYATASSYTYTDSGPAFAQPSLMYNNAGTSDNRKPAPRLFLYISLPIILVGLLATVLFFVFSGQNQGNNGQNSWLSGQRQEHDDGQKLWPDEESDDSQTLWLSELKTGDTCEFGRYEQNNIIADGEEPIEWIVLEKSGNSALLISSYSLDKIPYNNSNTSVTWAGCDLRAWLNWNFYNGAFNDEEKTYITDRTLVNHDSYTGADGGVQTTDKVFCLSVDEVNYYMPTEYDRYASHTAYASTRGKNDKCAMAWWWTRTPGERSELAAVISGDDGTKSYGKYSIGMIVKSGNYVHGDYIGVRPVIYLTW